MFEMSKDPKILRPVVFTSIGMILYLAIWTHPSKLEFDS